jgi:inner membrane transporter RhtA
MRVRSVGLLLVAGVSTQFGAAYATTLFDRTGPAGTVFLRLLIAAAVLVVVFRPLLRGRTRAQLRSVALLGLALAVMNFGWYQALARQPLGPTVTLEFLGPLAVAVYGSRRPRDFIWIQLAAGGVALLGGGGR